MKVKMKKTIRKAALFLTACLFLVTTKSMPVFAATTLSENDIPVMGDSQLIASGEGWTLDVNGHLSVEFTCTDPGYRRPWGSKYKDDIKTASLNLKTYTSLAQLFYDCKNLVSVDFMDSDLSQVTTADYMFSGCESLKEIKGITLPNVETVKGMFDECYALETLDTSFITSEKITDVSYMFNDCDSLKSVDASALNTSNVTDMSYMFCGCNALETVNLSNWNTSKVTDMKGMFSFCEEMTQLDITGFDTSNVTNMASMFAGMEKVQNLDITKLRTSKVTNMGCMFMYVTCPLDFSNFDTSSVTNMAGMFLGSATEILDLSSFDTSNVTNMTWMFMGAMTKQVDVTSFDTKNVQKYMAMFSGCKNIEILNLGSFDMSGTKEGEEAYLGDFISTTESLNKFTAPKNIPGVIYIGSGGIFYDAQGIKYISAEKGLNYAKTYWKIPYGDTRNYIILDDGTKVTIQGAEATVPNQNEEAEAPKAPTVTETEVTKPEPKEQTIRVSKKASKTVIYKKSKLKKKSRTFKIEAVINEGQPHGIVSYKVTKWPKGGEKYISVSRKGVVTMKRGAKKGTYKITITVNAVEGMFKKATKVVTIKVK